jgi:FkbM family methyltransferase
MENAGNNLTFDQVLQQYLSTQATKPYFVQIGAFDGVSGDPLFPWVKQGKLAGCLIEPQADAFERLQANYAGVDGVAFKRAAIGPQAGNSTLFRIRPGSIGPEWLFQLASFDRSILLRHAPFVPGLEQMIITETVPTITVEQLLAELPARPNVLVIDTEGYDFELIKLWNVPRRKPEIILYEHKHLTTADQAACRQHLIENGYRVHPLDQDTVATLV